jgi:hypothetical protein
VSDREEKAAKGKNGGLTFENRPICKAAFTLANGAYYINQLLNQGYEI